ncbi:MAG: transcriptional regulator, partial [Hydrogenophaga sp.]
MTEALLTALRQIGGHASSPQLQTQLGVSQPTVSRALRPLLAAGQVLKVGAARAQRYLLPRAIEGVGAVVPITEILASGEARPFGTLIALVGGGFWMEEAQGQSAFHASLPWFLYDMRPQGFLGRGFSPAHPTLHLPTNLNHWSDDHILKALVHAGVDQPGNLLVGALAFDLFLSRQPAANRQPAIDYPPLAQQALGSGQGGSSAGGEQPKFSAQRDGHPVLVKFSSAGDGPADQRWRDLLICE